nr:GNAT family N-acetyltransferase [Aliiroseovarius sediminis]
MVHAAPRSDKRYAGTSGPVDHRLQGDTALIRDRQPRPVVGRCGAHTGNEIGFIPHPDVWGQGIAKEATRAVIDHVWQVTDFPKLTADLDPRQQASKRLLLALGFQTTGSAENTYCVDWVWTHSLYVALSCPPGMEKGA